MDSLPISKTVSLESAGLNERWLQDQIWENPSCLGLGELEGITREHAVSSGGKVDILLRDPVDDLMFEVETVLGDTDPDHIIRTIEYWDLIRRKWPQHQHFAVLVAERVTKRFFNVIRILSDAVPLIAIQVNIVESPHGRSLHFTKILDIYQEPDVDPPDGDQYDESYWASYSAEALQAAKTLQAYTRDIYGECELRFNKYSICLASGSYIQMRVRRRKGKRVLIGFRYSEQQGEEIRKILDGNEIQYTEQHKHFRLQLPLSFVEQNEGLFGEIARLNHEWWKN